MGERTHTLGPHLLRILQLVEIFSNIYSTGKLSFRKKMQNRFEKYEVLKSLSVIIYNESTHGPKKEVSKVQILS